MRVVVVEGKILIPIMELILQIGIILKREVDMKCKGVHYVYLPMKGAVTCGNMFMYVGRLVSGRKSPTKMWFFVKPILLNEIYY